MASDENTAALRRVYDAFSTGNFDELDDLIAADMVDHNPDPEQGPGLEGLKKAFTKLRATVPDLQFRIEDLLPSGDTVVARLTVSGTDEGGLVPGGPATGKTFSVALIDIIRFADGKAVERWGVFDALSMLQQLGAVSQWADGGA